METQPKTSIIDLRKIELMNDQKTQELISSEGILENNEGKPMTQEQFTKKIGISPRF